MRVDPRPHWFPTTLGLDGANGVPAGTVEVSPDDLHASLRARRRLSVRVRGQAGRGLILRRVPVGPRPSARVSPDDEAALRGAAAADATLEFAAPTWWTTLRGLPGPSTTLAVATLVTALLVAAPLVVGGPSQSGRTASAALVEVQRVDDDLAQLTELAERLDAAADAVPAGRDRADVRRAAHDLQVRADRLAAWEDDLAARAARSPSTDPWDVAAKLAALVTAVLSFVVAYRGLRPGG